MATITALTYLDSGTARTAGEAMTINGGRLIVRTDTRWHANAPASMTGTTGSVAISASLGGGYELDGTQVRWLAITGGSGSAAIGATVTQGAVSGYFLGFWASLTSAPSTTIGATGFIKFREVTGGTFAAGALSGITATAAGVDVPGWIEVVHDQSANITVPRLGDFKCRGNWFALGTTSGAANQLVQVPTNGSSTTYVPGVWIETATADVYEFYPALYADAMTTTNLGTDARSKFVCMETNGQVRIGHNGTTTVGYVPPAGRKVRIANVLGRQCTTAARATNVIPSSTAATRPEFNTTTAGAIDAEFLCADWYYGFNQAYSVRLAHGATFEQSVISECATAFSVQDFGIGHSQSIDARTMQLTSNFAGGLVEDCVLHRFSAGVGDHAVEVIYNVGITLRRVKSGIITYARSSGYPIQLTQSSDITVEDCGVYNGNLPITTCTNITVRNLDLCDRYVGATNATSPNYAVAVTATSKNILVDGLTYGLGGTVADVHAYNGAFNAGQSQDVTFRNLGTRSAFVNGGSALQGGYIYNSSGNNQRVRVQRCYMLPTRTGAVNTVNSDKWCTYDHVYGDWADTFTIAGLNEHVRGVGASPGVSGQSSVYGTHFWHAFTSDTVGSIILSLNEPTTDTLPYVTTVSGAPKFTSAGQLSMPAIGDEIVWEMDYFAKGFTAFSGTPTVTGTNITYSSGARWGNHDVYFQVDTGSGFGGTWLDFNTATLAAQPVSAAGTRLKLRVVCAVANTGNLLTYISALMASTLSAQADNLYPLDVTTLTVTGLQAGSDVVVLQAGTTNVLTNVDAYAGTSWAYQYETAQAVDIGVLKPGYVPLYIRNYSLGTTDASLLVTQTPDRNYLA